MKVGDHPELGVAIYGSSAAFEKVKKEGRPMAQCGLSPDAPAMTLDDARRNGQSDAVMNVRRASVTLASGSLQARNLISYRRGRIEILDHARLEAASCSCDRPIEVPHPT